MRFRAAVRSCFRQWWACEGRASRSEYWWWQLFVTLSGIPFAIIDKVAFPHVHFPPPLASGPADLLWSLVTLLPGLFVMVRRLHDVNRSFWWMFIGMTGIGFIPLFWWMVKKGDAGENRFGAAQG